MIDDASDDSDRLVVETAQGRVRGDHRRGACRFRGIPYAAPPVGERRFAPPADPDGWTGVRDATLFSPVAPQPPDLVSQLLGRGDGREQSEADCLTLNVWTPAPDGARRPVMVWIHGGAFVSGTGAEAWYDGANLTRRDVVVVTVNYRLGALGFLHLAELAGDAFSGSGNVGLLDQAAALRWVRENIAAFGGDPDNVTIFGESAGGMSVAALLGLPAAAGTFHRAIAQSGAAANISDPDRATRVAVDLLGELGLDAGAVHRLRTVPTNDLLAAQAAVSARHGIIQGLPFQPVVDPASLPVAPAEAVRSGSAAAVPLLIGSNRDELRVFTLMNPDMRADSDEHLTARLRGFAGDRAPAIVAAYRQIWPDLEPTGLFEKIGSDLVFRIPALDLAEAQRTHASCHVYEFHQESTGFGGQLGASHAVDVPFVFDNLDAPGASFFTGEPDEQMRRVATTMADAWCAFAHGGDPNTAGLPEWSGWQGSARPTLIFDGEPRVVDDPAARQRMIWQATG